MSKHLAATATPLPRDVSALAAIFATSGAIHLVRPQTFEPIMPDFVPAHREVIYLSGVLELLCAAGLVHPRTRRAAGWASAALLLAVYPANLKQAGDVVQGTRSAAKAAVLARLPLQIPMIRSALKAARG